MERLRELNLGLNLGLRYPVFLARRNELAKTAMLRICLTTGDIQEYLNIDTPAGGVIQIQY